MAKLFVQNICHGNNSWHGINSLNNFCKIMQRCNIFNKQMCRLNTDAVVGTQMDEQNDRLTNICTMDSFNHLNNDIINHNHLC